MSSRTIVVAPNWVGDAVMAEPVFRALADSGRQLVVAAKPGLLPLLGLFPGVVATLAHAGEEADVVDRYRAAGAAEAIVLPNSFRAALRPARAGIPRRYGYRGELRGLLLRPSVSRPPERRPQVEDYRELLGAMAVPAPTDWVPRLTLPDELAARGRERLDRAGIRRGAPTADGARSPAAVIGLFPGAEWGSSKRWPMLHFAALATELRRRIADCRQLILVGPKEVWLGVRVHEESGKLHPVVGPDLDLAGLAAVLGELDLLVTNDSGPMHLAAALGVPTVALFGPTDPRRTAPTGIGHAVLSRGLWCSPCFRRRCPLLHHGCLAGIPPSEVAAAVEGALAGARARAAAAGARPR